MKNHISPYQTVRLLEIIAIIQMIKQQHLITSNTSWIQNIKRRYWYGSLFDRRVFPDRFFFIQTSYQSFVYLNKYIKPRLIPFIKRDIKYIFWPDQAGAHYSNLIVEYLRKIRSNLLKIRTILQMSQSLVQSRIFGEI